MPRPPKSEGATTRALTVPLAEVAQIKFAPSRLLAAEQAHGRAKAALEDAQSRRSELARRLAAAEADERTAAQGAEREQTTRRDPAERGVTVTTFGEQNPAGIGLQHSAQSYEDTPRTTSPALKRFTEARDAVASLKPLLERLDADTIPAATARLQEAAAALRRAEDAADRLELAKAYDAAPALIAADAEYVAAADALEAARVAAMQVRDSLAQTYGQDDRFAAKHLALGLSAPVAKLAADFASSPAGTTGGLLDLHRNSFDLEA